MIELVHKAQNGDDNAFLTIFQEYEEDLYRMAYLYVKNKDDALDVIQETAYRAFKNIQTLKKPQYIKTWLTKIAMSCATDILRKKKKVIYLNPEFTEFLGTNEDDIPLSLSLQDLLESLNETEKNIVFLKFYDGYTFNEISNIVEVPLGTVKSVLYRALQKLRDQARRVDMI